MYDLVFRNARIADGLGNPLIEGDLAVTGGHVAAIGRIKDTATETIDAGGLVLAPGVIDLHTHYDAQLTWDNGPVHISLYGTNILNYQYFYESGTPGLRIAGAPAQFGVRASRTF